MVGISCPLCQQSESVVLNGFNRGGSQRMRCQSCRKTFTPQPNSQKVTPAKEAAIVGLLAERVSQRGIARALSVSRDTVRAVRKKRPQP